MYPVRYISRLRVKNDLAGFAVNIHDLAGFAVNFHDLTGFAVKYPKLLYFFSTGSIDKKLDKCHTEEYALL